MKARTILFFLAPLAAAFLVAGCGLFSSDDSGGDDSLLTGTTIVAGVEAETGDGGTTVSTTTTVPFLDRGFPTELDRIETLDTGNVLSVMCLGRTLRLIGDAEMTELKTKLLGDYDVTADQVGDAIDHGCDDADGDPEVATRIFMQDLGIDDDGLTGIVEKNCDQWASENNNSVEGIEFDAIVRLAMGASDEDLSAAILDVCGPERFSG